MEVSSFDLQVQKLRESRIGLSLRRVESSLSFLRSLPYLKKKFPLDSPRDPSTRRQLDFHTVLPISFSKILFSTPPSNVRISASFPLFFSREDVPPFQRCRYPVPHRAIFWSPVFPVQTDRLLPPLCPHLAPPCRVPPFSFEGRPFVANPRSVNRSEQYFQGSPLRFPSYAITLFKPFFEQPSYGSRVTFVYPLSFPSPPG